MKKFISIAVAGVVGAVGFASVASADASFYGRVTAGAVHVDNDTPDDDGTWNFGTTGNGLATRLGFRGSQDLGSGMEAGFQIERALGHSADGRSNFNKRHQLAYISGDWGRLTLGNQNNPYMNARHWDQSYFYGGAFGASYRHEGINYSMSSGPFSLNIMALATSGDEDSIDADGIPEVTAVAAVTANPGATPPVVGVPAASAVAAGQIERGGNDSVDGWIVHVGYDFGVAALNVSHHADNADYDVTQGMVTAAAGGTAAQNAAIDARGRASSTRLGNAAADTNASRDRTAVGLNGSVGPLDWYLAYETSELNASGTGVDDNDTTSVGGFLGFNASENDTIYAYYVAHSGDRATYQNNNRFAGVNCTTAMPCQTLGEDYTETIIGYSRDMGPGVRFIAEYQAIDRDLENNANRSDTSNLALAIRYVF